MVTDRLFRRLRKLIQTEDTLAQAADKAGVDEKTARKYRDSDPLPGQRRVPHTHWSLPKRADSLFDCEEGQVMLQHGVELLITVAGQATQGALQDPQPA